LIARNSSDDLRRLVQARLGELAPHGHVAITSCPPHTGVIGRVGVASVEPAETATAEKALRAAAQRGRPFGGTVWAKQAAARLGLEATFRPRGRPRKESE